MSGWQVNNNEADGWADGDDHKLIEWDETHVAAIYSGTYGDPGDYYGGCRMITLTPGSPAVPALGTECVYYTSVTYPDEGSSGWAPESVKVGNLLVQARGRTNRMFTMEYDSGTDTFSVVDVVDIPWVNTSGGGSLTTRSFLLYYDTDTLLIIKGSLSTFGNGYGSVMFAKWNGASWDFTAQTDVANVKMDNNSYGSSCVVIDSVTGDPTGVFIGIDMGSANQFYYYLVTGTAAAAPIVTPTAQLVLDQLNSEYCPHQLFSTPRHSFAYGWYLVPCDPGTNTPSGAMPFDWGALQLTVASGVVTEGAVSNTGVSCDGYYDLAVTETLDGNLWVCATTPGYSAVDSVTARDVTGGVSYVVADTTDSGIKPSDFSWRTIGSFGNDVLLLWETNNNSLVLVDSVVSPFAPQPSGAGHKRQRRRSQLTVPAYDDNGPIGPNINYRNRANIYLGLG